MRKKPRYQNRFSHFSLFMFTDYLLHPNHVVPAAKLLAALVKVGHSTVAKLFMEAYTVLCQIFIFCLNE